MEQYNNKEEEEEEEEKEKKKKRCRKNFVERRSRFDVEIIF